MTLFLFLSQSGCNSPLNCCSARRQRHFLRCAPVAILGLSRKVDNTDIMTAHESVRFFFLSYLTNAGQDPHQDNFSASRYVEGGSRPSPTVCWVRLRACTVNKRRVLRPPFCLVRHPTRGVEGAAPYNAIDVPSCLSSRAK